MFKVELRNWSFIRILRLVIVVFVTFQAIETQTWWMLLLSAVLLYQVIVNMSCRPCQTGGCDLPVKSPSKKKIIIYK